MTVKEDYQSFEQYVSEGVEVTHSGVSGTITVYTVKDYYDVDEVSCENDFSDHFCSEDVSIEDILNGNVSVSEFEVEQAYTSFVNGQFAQFRDQIENLDDIDDFITYLEYNTEEDQRIRVLEHLVSSR